MDIVHFIRNNPEHKVGDFTIAQLISQETDESGEPMSVDAYCEWMSKELAKKTKTTQKQGPRKNRDYMQSTRTYSAKCFSKMH